MTNEEFRSALKSLGIRQRWLADKLGVHHTSVNRWATGERPVPKWAEFVLELLREQQS